MRYHQRGHIGCDGPGSDEDFSIIEAIILLIVVGFVSGVIWGIIELANKGGA